MLEEGGSQERRGRSREKARSSGQRAQERAGLAKRRATSALGLPWVGSNHFCRHRPLPLRSGLALKEPLQIRSHRLAGVGKWCGKGRQEARSGQRGFPAGARHRPLSHSRPRGPGTCPGGDPSLHLPGGRGPLGHCLASLTPTPGPAAEPVGLAGVGGAAVRPPALTVLQAQGRVQNPLRLPARVHLGAAQQEAELSEHQFEDCLQLQ